jgi:hypothetical protein
MQCPFLADTVAKVENRTFSIGVQEAAKILAIATATKENLFKTSETTMAVCTENPIGLMT